MSEFNDRERFITNDHATVISSPRNIDNAFLKILPTLCSALSETILNHSPDFTKPFRDFVCHSVNGANSRDSK